MRRTGLLTALPIAALAALTGCGEQAAVTVNDGECKAFKRAAIETCGLTQADQDIIDENTERGVSACRWARPQPRVPSCDDLRAEIEALRTMQPRAVIPTKAPPKKPLWRRVLRR